MSSLSKTCFDVTFSSLRASCKESVLLEVAMAQTEQLQEDTKLVAQPASAKAKEKK